MLDSESAVLVALSPSCPEGTPKAVLWALWLAPTTLVLGVDMKKHAKPKLTAARTANRIVVTRFLTLSFFIIFPSKEFVEIYLQLSVFYCLLCVAQQTGARPCFFCARPNFKACAVKLLLLLFYYFPHRHLERSRRRSRKILPDMKPNKIHSTTFVTHVPHFTQYDTGGTLSSERMEKSARTESCFSHLLSVALLRDFSALVEMTKGVRSK